MVNRRRIAGNTLLLYLRMGLIMIISLYTSRVVLNVLGETDFGLYNVIGGIVVTFAFLNSVMSAACNRYYSVELGRQNYEGLHKVFGVNIFIFIAISLMILLLSETVGLWILERKMSIPADRMDAARWVYQLSIFSFIASVLVIPFKSIVTAKEKMKVYAYCSIVEAVLKLGAVFLLAVAPIDKLVFYAVLMLIVSVGTNAFYPFYCFRFYKECRGRIEWDRKLGREILGFNGWGVIGSMATIGRNQGINILLNMFYGPAVNAARGVANIVYFNIYKFVDNYVFAVNPQIVKSYAAGERDDMMKLVFQTSKFAYFLLFVIVLPLVLEINQVLDLWLVEVPAHTVAFTVYMLAAALIDSMSHPLYYSVQATGKVKWYNIIVGGTQIMVLVLSYVILKLIKVQPELVFQLILLFSAIAQVLRIIITTRCTRMHIGQYLLKVLLPVVLVTIVSPALPWLVVHYMAPSFGRLCLTVLVSIVTVGIAVWLIGLDGGEKQKILLFIKSNGRNDKDHPA